MADPDQGIVVVFKNHSLPNPAKSKEKGRPIYDDMEICEIRYPGDRNRVSVFPAHDFTQYKIDDEDGSSRQVTYAERFAKQYQRFKAKEAQVKEGTPLEELTFLSAAKRSELKGLNIYTAEDLAGLDGQPLKQLGMGGRQIKTQAQAYLDRADNTSLVTKQAAEIEELRAQIASMKGFDQAPATAPEPATTEQAKDGNGFDSWSDADLKAYIKNETGDPVRGNPSHETLVRMADEVTGADE